MSTNINHEILAKTYRTSKVAKMFGKTTVWIYWAEGAGILERPDGSKIIPRRTTPPKATAGYRCYTLQDIRDIADALRRRGTIDQAEYLQVMSKIADEELKSAP